MPRRPAQICPILAVTLLIVSGCRDWYQPVEVVAPECAATTPFTVGPGARPTLSWGGACRISGAMIEFLESDTTTQGTWVWGVHREGAGFETPLILGDASAETIGRLPEYDLLPGRRYRVRVLRVAPEGFAISMLSAVDVAPR